MTGGWQVVGYFGLPTSEVPEVKPAAVLDPTGARVVASDIAESEADLEGLEDCPVETFRSCVAEGSAVPLLAVPWKPGVVVLVTAGVAELVPVEAAEARLNEFVRDEREAGQRALRDGEWRAALEHFDRARRVSSEHEDIEAVATLTRSVDS